MKFLRKADETYSLKSLFTEHVNKFAAKHDQELAFLEDVRNFIQKKSQIELQYAQSLSKLCQQYMTKSEYQLTTDVKSKIYIPEKWKILLEQYSYVAEKKQVSSKSLLMHCDYFKNMREQKNTLNQMALNYLKKMQQTLNESHHNCETAFKAYCVDQLLCDQLTDGKKFASANLDKKLKKRKINSTKFKKSLEELTKDPTKATEKKKRVDFSRLNYVTMNCCQNQQLQYYFSMEIPQLLQLQNGNIDHFIDECLNSLIFKEIDNSQFLIKQLEDGVANSVLGSIAAPANSSDIQVYNYNSSENFFVNSHECFNNLIQFELESYDTEFDQFEYTFQKDNFNELSNDFLKWSSKLGELELLMKTMLEQVNEKRIALNQQISDSGKVVLKERQEDFQISHKLEEQRFLLAEKKMQMIQLQAKIDALGVFNINLKELEEYNSAAKFAERKHEFDSDLYQNLELWDSLMKSIDEIQFSDGSYDVDYVRRLSSSNPSQESVNSSSPGAMPVVYDPSKRKESTDSAPQMDEPSVSDLRYAKTLLNFKAENKEYLSFESSQSLIIYDEISNGILRAKNNIGRIGLVDAKHIEFYPEEPTYVKSVYAYEGLDEKELSFPSDCYIRLLRKNISDRKVEGEEEWWEGAYEGRLGFFPAIFAQEFGRFDKAVNEDDDEPNNKTLEGPSSFEANETSLQSEIANARLQSPVENQQVPG